MPLSIQQIKFELLSHVKEFGGDAACWYVGTTEDAPQELFENLRIDRANDVWVWKPAVSTKAANLIAKWMIDRQMSSAANTRCSGACVFLYRRSY